MKVGNITQTNRFGMVGKRLATKAAIASDPNKMKSRPGSMIQPQT
jgi:hypothetical protein